jgi:hypothetical protein
MERIPKGNFMTNLSMPVPMLPDEEKDLVLEALNEIIKNGKLPADPAVATLLTLAAVRQLVGEISRTRNTLRNLQWFIGVISFVVTGITAVLIDHTGGILTLFK